MISENIVYSVSIMLYVPNDVIRLFLDRTVRKALYAFSFIQRRLSQVIVTRISITPRYTKQVSTYFAGIIDINRLPGDHGYIYAFDTDYPSGISM